MSDLERKKVLIVGLGDCTQDHVERTINRFRDVDLNEGLLPNHFVFFVPGNTMTLEVDR